MEELRKKGVEYISNRVIQENDAVMFDIDDTLIRVDKQPIVPMIKLLDEAIFMGYNIVIITARPGFKPVIQWTMEELAEYGISYDYLGFTSAETKGLMKQQLPYNFVLSVGDLYTDLTDSQHFLNTSNFYHN
jgi:ribonucleotide monophosphatase NagD (HAD superfamily)